MHTANRHKAPRARQPERALADEALRELLDETTDQLQRLDITGMPAVATRLDEIRRERTPAEWRAVIDQLITPHPFRTYALEDPFTRHAYEKPRGYPGDAALLDLIYADGSYEGELSPLGAQLHPWAVTSPGCQSVRERRSILASLIDRVARERTHPRVLALACGHLREAEQSEAVQSGAIDEIIAVDQDQRSLDVVNQELIEKRVRAVRASVRRFLIDPTAFGSFDLIYAAGLYDYLDDAVAQQLTAAMFSALKPEGTLLAANFAPSLVDIGYMEAIMNWNLIYRDEPSVASFAALLPADAERSIFRDTPANVIYLMVRKC